MYQQLPLIMTALPKAVRFSPLYFLVFAIPVSSIGAVHPCKIEKNFRKAGSGPSPYISPPQEVRLKSSPQVQKVARPPNRAPAGGT